MKRIPLLSVVLFLGAIVARGGPYSDEFTGVPATSLLQRAWISAVVRYEPGPTPGSGGYAHDENNVTVPVANAVTGRPSDFTLNGTTRHVVSLGNGGRITVTFPLPISDGPGPDFAVFENGFSDASDFFGTPREGLTNSFSFAELAFVEVGSSTQAWARFPVTALNTEALYQITIDDHFASQDVTGLDGLAGKHILSQGTPFDLALLTNHPAVLNGSVNLALIRYIRLTDVVGDGSTTDDVGRAIYDPYYDSSAVTLQPAAASPTDGFDLRGIAVINAGEASVLPGPAGPAVSCPGVAHTAYRLEYAPALDATNWTPLATVTGRGDRITWTNTPATSCVFRVQRWALP